MNNYSDRDATRAMINSTKSWMGMDPNEGFPADNNYKPAVIEQAPVEDKPMLESTPADEMSALMGTSLGSSSSGAGSYMKMGGLVIPDLRKQNSVDESAKYSLNKPSSVATSESQMELNINRKLRVLEEKLDKLLANSIKILESNQQVDKLMEILAEG